MKDINYITASATEAINKELNRALKSGVSPSLYEVYYSGYFNSSKDAIDTDYKELFDTFRWRDQRRECPLFCEPVIVAYMDNDTIVVGTGQLKPESWVIDNERIKRADVKGWMPFPKYIQL